MNYKILIFILLFGNLIFAQSEKLDSDEIENIKKIIKVFKQKDINAISKTISFPLTREYPIPPIENEKELKARFNEVFSTTLINSISNSKISQWSEVGWRGITLDNGILWIDSDGKISAVNYQSDFEKKLKEKLILQQKANLHASLKDFKKPIYK